MAASDFVLVTVSVSSAPATGVLAFGVPLIAAYHTHWANGDRIRYYPTSSIGTSMVADGFSVNEPAYKGAQVIASQPTPPSRIGIGRRTSIPLQQLTFTCTDGLPGDGYAFTLVGSDGKSHAITYNVAPNAGSALASSATTNVTNGSAGIAFSVAQTLLKGGALQFGTGAQPGVFYFLSANVTSSTAGLLTQQYTGTTNATAPTTYTAPLTGTMTTSGSPGSNILTSSSQVGVVAVGDAIMFASQPGTFYQVTAVSASAITLSSPFTGTGSGTDTAVDLSTTTQAATAITTLINAISGVAATIGTVTSATNVITLNRTDGALTDIRGWATGPVQNLQIANTTADPGIAADIAAFLKADTIGWYGFVLDSNSKAEILAAQASIEATGQGGKFAFYDNADYVDETASTTDVLSQLQSLQYQKCFCGVNQQALLSWEGAATCGYALGQIPGSYNLAYKSLTGVPADVDTSLTETQALIVNTQSTAQPGSGGKNGNYYKGLPGAPFLWPGSTPKGNFVDTVIFEDWVEVNVQNAVLAVLRSLPKVPYTDNGIGQIGDAIQGVLVQGAANGGIDGSQPITVTLPKAASLSSATRASRDVPGVSATAKLAGAIDTLSSLKIVLVP